MRVGAVAKSQIKGVTMSEREPVHAGRAGTIEVGGDLVVNRLGFGAMRITGARIWGQPGDRDEAKAVLRRAIELGVTSSTSPTPTGPRSARS